MSPANDPTRQRILEAAGEVFAEKGFDDASVREICGRAKANVAAVNYHFRDKFGLYVEAVKQAHCQQGPPDFGWIERTPAEQKLSDFLHHMLAMMLDRDRPTWHLELVLREMAHPTKACEDLVREFIAPMFSVLLSILDELLPAGVSLLNRQQLGFSIIGQCLLYKFHRPVGKLLIGESAFEAVFNVDATAAQVLTFSLGGIAAVARNFSENQKSSPRSHETAS